MKSFARRRAATAAAAAATASAHTSMIDVLETRRLFAALPVNGTSNADVIRVSVAGPDIVVTINGTTTTYADATYDGISVAGGDGADAIYIDSNGTNPTTVNGGTGVDSIYLGEGPGTLDDLDGAIVAVSTDGVDSLFLDDSENPFSDQFNLSASGNIIRGEFAGVTQSGFATVSLDAGPADDIITVFGTPATGTYRLLGGDGSDGFDVRQTNGASVIVDGQDGDDLLDINVDGGAGGTVYFETTQVMESILTEPGGNLVLLGTAGLVLTGTESGVEGDVTLNQGFIIERDSQTVSGLGYWRERLRNGVETPPPNEPRLTSAFAQTSPIDDTLGYGYAQNIDPTTFAGFELNEGDLLIRYTRRGDADLSGTVDFDDLLALARNYGQAGDKGWTQGDFDLDGDTDFNDLLGLARNYNQSVPPPPASAASAEMAAASEPATATRKRASAADLLA